MTTNEELSYPRLAARTLRFTLGAPRNFTVSPDGARVAFLRAPSGTDRRIQLWTYDVATGTERLIAEPATLLAGGTGEELSPEERARRERLREGAGGIVGYATDRDVRIAAFTLSSRLWLADLDSGEVRELPARSPVVDPRPDPTGTLVAYASNGELRVSRTDGSMDRALVRPDGENVAWGMAEFIASEELSRYRGFWWAPDGTALLAERYDETPVGVWSIADPANPDRPPAQVRYPAAGTPNAAVSLWWVGLAGQEPAELAWDHDRFPYLGNVSWPDRGGPLVWVLTRDQRTARLLGAAVPTGDRSSGKPGDSGTADDSGGGESEGGESEGGEPGNGTSQKAGAVAVEVLQEAYDDAWIDVVPGVPARLPDGRILTTVDTGADAASTRRLAADGRPVTPEGLQVGGVLDVGENGILVSATTEPTEQHVYLLAPDGTLSPVSSEPGIHTASAGGPVTVLNSWSPHRPGVHVRVLKDGQEVGRIASRQVDPPFAPSVTLLRLGDRELRAAVLFPRDHVPGSRRLPLLLDPYGGPHAQRVRAAANSYLASQWLADQGFCVVVADGRGTPNRGPAWERQVRHDFVGTLDDQVEAVERVAERYPDDVDPGRVAIRGWSYGGYLAALAVLHRPDVFHAAVAGAPVTEWRLYDTAYTERYLGDPNAQPEVYERNSLLTSAGDLRRPLLLIHGLADDNVVAAHTLRLSSALLAAGRPHTVLPLSGVTHMTPQEVVAENMLHLELDFIHRAFS